MIEYMETAVNTIVQYLQKCIECKSYDNDFAMPEKKGLNCMIHNIKDFLIKQDCKYDDQYIYLVYICLLYLSYNNFAFYDVEDNIEETYANYKSITDKWKFKNYTHDEYLNEIINTCYKIMNDVEIPCEIYVKDIYVPPLFDSLAFIRLYLQKCIKEKSFEVDYKVTYNTKFLNQILSNVKRDLQLLQKRGYKYNDNAIYQEWYAIRLLALHHFDLQESKHYIRVMWYEDPDEFDKCRDRKTHAINFEEISDIMNNIMRNVKVPKNYVYPENIHTKLL